jgi:catechol-2,3-dioxygenase
MEEAMLGPRVTLGHVHLKVRDLARAEAFYTTTLGGSSGGSTGR